MGTFFYLVLLFHFRMIAILHVCPDSSANTRITYPHMTNFGPSHTFRLFCVAETHRLIHHLRAAHFQRYFDPGWAVCEYTGGTDIRGVSHRKRLFGLNFTFGELEGTEESNSIKDGTDSSKILRSDSKAPNECHSKFGSNRNIIRQIMYQCHCKGRNHLSEPSTCRTVPIIRQTIKSPWVVPQISVSSHSHSAHASAEMPR